jgi:DNA-binding CsgD family transcriptional regulator
MYVRVMVGKKIQFEKSYEMEEIRKISINTMKNNFNILNFEMSLDGNNFIPIKNLEQNEKLIVVQAIKILFSRYSLRNSSVDSSILLKRNNIYIKIDSNNLNDYFEQFEHQKKNYELLTKKERIMLCFLGRGHRPKQTAYVLNITLNTFYQHKKNIYRKMNFHNKVQLAVWCDRFLKKFFRLN